MGSLTPSTLFFPILLFSLFFTSIEVESQPTSRLKTYIVHVEQPDTTILDKETWYMSFLPTTIMISDGKSSTRMIHMYNNVMSGFAARLTEEEVDEMSKKKGFVNAYPDRRYRRQTTHTPSFLGLNLPMGLWDQSNFGEGVIIGVLDDGVTPDHPSFRGEGMPPPPSKWKGWCEFKASICNNKIIGARVFLKAAAAEHKVTWSPIDEFGHGTHTATTAAGAFVPNAQFLGNAGGIASGMAPYAHLALYRVCWEDGCEGSDILDAIEAAISDGVDVISMSLGEASLPFYEDLMAIGSFHATQKGVFVSCAASNDGPNPSTLKNEAPWILTVAASTNDRSIEAKVTLGNRVVFNGQSLFQPQNYAPTLIPLVYAGAGGNQAAGLCGSLDGMDVKGKAVLCEVGGDLLGTEKGSVVSSAGGAAMILMNQKTEGYITRADLHVLPASHVSYSDGLKIKNYIKSTTNPTVQLSFEGTVYGTTPSPTIADFSSRGPSLASPGILKPDITGPGVHILAAWPFPADPRSTGVNFNMISGTSMSAPHLSGIAALLKSAHPDWSPAAIKSAIMTTADVLDQEGNPIVDEQHEPANLFAMGAGHVNPTKTSNPGLVYDLDPNDYIPYLCGLGYTSSQVKMIVNQPIDCSSVKSITEGELNYPSITVLFSSDTSLVTLERTVKNVGGENSAYWSEIDVPAGVLMNVEPKMLQFSKVSNEITFTVKFSRSKSDMNGAVSQGYLKWVSKDRIVRSPVSITFK